MQIVEVLFWCIYCYRFQSLWDDEIGEMDEFGNVGSQCRVLGSNENSPLVFLRLLVVIVDVTRVLIPVVEVSNFQLYSVPFSS